MALVALGRATGRLFTEALEPTGLKPRHLGVLGRLRLGPLTQQSLADAVHTDPTQLVALLNELEAAELVSRRRDPDDRRRHIVELSSAGSRRLAEAERRVEQAEQRLLAGLTLSERGQFAQVLGMIVANTGITIDCDSVTDASVDIDTC